MQRRMMTALTGLILAAAVPLPALAQERPAPVETLRIDKTRIDKMLATMVAGGRAAGVSALVWKDGREAYYGEHGLADREGDKPFRRDTLVQIWSMTKPVTGVALMQLWEQGKFRLDDPLARYLPEFANPLVQDGTDKDGKPVWRAASRPITIRDVLRHTAGFAYGDGPTAAHKAFAAADPLNLDNDLTEFGRRLASVPLLSEPGTEWHYSAAVVVQALLVERLSGMTFTDYIRTRIFEPLKMREAAWHQPMDRLPRLAHLERLEDMRADIVGELHAREALDQQRLHVHRRAVMPFGARLRQQRHLRQPMPELDEVMVEVERIGGGEGLVRCGRPVAIGEARGVAQHVADRDWPAGGAP